MDTREHNGDVFLCILLGLVEACTGNIGVAYVGPVGALFLYTIHWTNQLKLLLVFTRYFRGAVMEVWTSTETGKIIQMALEIQAVNSGLVCSPDTWIINPTFYIYC